MTEIETEAILLIKPCGMRKSVDGSTLSEVIEGLIGSVGLEIITKRCLTLSLEQIRELYPKLNRPDPVYGDGWKKPLLDHLQSGLSIVYHLIGRSAQTKAVIIKRAIRHSLAGDGSLRSRLLENLVHVADQADYNKEYKAFFGD